MALDLSDSRVQLAGMFNMSIQTFTRQTPMQIEDILEALCFTAGHAIAQKAAQKFKAEKELRETCIRALDRGIVEGNRPAVTGPQIILPSRN